MYQEYDPKFYPTIKNVVLGFTNKIFGTKSKADRMNIDIFSTFESKPEWEINTTLLKFLHQLRPNK